MDANLSKVRADKNLKLMLSGFLLLAISLIFIFLLIRKHKRIKKEREKNATLEKEASKRLIEHSREILANQSKLIIDKNRIIEDLKNNLNLLFEDVEEGNTKVQSFLEDRILTNEDWDRFKLNFKVVYPNFIKKCESKFQSITSSELRLICLHKLGMSRKEMAEMLGVLDYSVKRTVNRFYKKNNFDHTTEMPQVIQSIDDYILP
jgi:DNA-binding NarL/FixJ family response regulator